MNIECDRVYAHIEHWTKAHTDKFEEEEEKKQATTTAAAAEICICI